MNGKQGVWACALAASFVGSASAETIVSLPWLTFLSAGTRAQNYPPAQNDLDIWVIEDFRTNRDWLLDQFTCTGNGSSATRDVFVMIVDAFPPNGQVVATSTPGSGRCADGAGRNGWDLFSAQFGGRRLPAGNYYIIWQADLDPGVAPAVMFSQDGPYAVGMGDPDTSWRYWPNQNHRTVLIGRNLDGTGPGIGTNFTLTGRPAPCPGDTDGDGGVTIDDLFLFIERYAAGLPSADLDDGTNTGTPDGGVTVDDLLFYLARYAAGC